MRLFRWFVSRNFLCLRFEVAHVSVIWPFYTPLYRGFYSFFLLIVNGISRLWNF